MRQKFAIVVFLTAVVWPLSQFLSWLYLAIPVRLDPVAWRLISTLITVCVVVFVAIPASKPIIRWLLDQKR